MENLQNFVVVAENDESDWDDRPGEAYHFPKRYLNVLTPGTKVIYYKGWLKNKKFRAQRLTDQAHYFADAEIGSVYPDQSSTKGDLYADIVNYRKFLFPVSPKKNGLYIEPAPSTGRSQYWRRGARKIDQKVYWSILQESGCIDQPVINAPSFGFNDTEVSYESGTEGHKRQVYTTQYERDPKLRLAAIQIHGNKCIACGFDFEAAYGSYAQGYIQIHHKKPLSTADGERQIDPYTDLVPVCANCHAIIHRRKGYTLSVEQISEMVRKQKARQAITKNTKYT